MVMNIKYFCRLFRYEVIIYNDEHLIFIRELLEQLAPYFFNSTFTNETVTQEKNIPLLDEVNGGDTASNHHAINFYISFSCSTQGITTYDLTLNSAS